MAGTDQSAVVLRRRAIAARLEELGREMHQLREEYRSLAAFERLGAHLSVSIGGTRVLIPAEEVEETVAMVKLTPVAGGPAGVVGLFHHRGIMTTAVDLASYLVGVRQERGELLVVLSGSPRVAVTAQETQGLQSGLEVTYDQVDTGRGRTGVVAALARSSGGVLSVLNPEAVRNIVRGMEPRREGV